MTASPLKSNLDAVVAQLEPGNHRLPCPECDRGPKDTALSVTVEVGGHYVAHCFRCGFTAHSGGERVSKVSERISKVSKEVSQGSTAVQGGVGYRQLRPVSTAEPEQVGLSDWGLRFWTKCQPLSGTALAYLGARHCVIPPVDGNLRWHPRVRNAKSNYIGPALVALITDARTGKPLSLHRTWIRADGTKATHPAKMMLAGHSIAGGVIRLWPDDCVTYGLGIAEGIETALSLAWGFTPVWSLIDAGHLAKFEPLPGIDALTIAADNDANGKGQSAARECADRWSAAGAEVFITRQAANDLNDTVREVAA